MNSQAGRRPGGNGGENPGTARHNRRDTERDGSSTTPARGSGEGGRPPGKGQPSGPGGGAPIQRGRCRGCDAAVVWLTTPTGGKMICDPELVPFWPGTGTDRIIAQEDGRTLAGSARQPDLFSPEPIYGYAPHWGTCPNADDFRGGR